MTEKRSMRRQEGKNILSILKKDRVGYREKCCLRPPKVSSQSQGPFAHFYAHTAKKS